MWSGTRGGPFFLARPALSAGHRRSGTGADLGCRFSLRARVCASYAPHHRQGLTVDPPCIEKARDATASLRLFSHTKLPPSPLAFSLQPHQASHALAPLQPARASRLACRRPIPRAATAMVNVDFSPALVLGMGLIGGGLTLYQLRRYRPGLSRDFDVIVSSVAIFSGGILVFQGWRLDPLLLFCQLLTAGMALAFAVETLRLREEVAEAEVREEGEREGEVEKWERRS